MKLVKESGVYKALVSEAIASLIEASFSARWAYIEAYHTIGSGLAFFIDTTKHDNSRDVLQQVAKDVGVSERTMYYALKFYRMYPLLDEFPGGKNLGWKQVITKYLTEGSEKKKIPPPQKLPPMTAKGYIEYTKNSKCVIMGCPLHVDADHFPRTRGAGGDAHEVIPLCRAHHTERTHDPFAWWCSIGWENRVSIFKHFYDFIGGEHET